MNWMSLVMSLRSFKDMKELISAIDRNFTSPNESGSNLEPANIVDALIYLARAIDRLAKKEN